MSSNASQEIARRFEWAVTIAREAGASTLDRFHRMPGRFDRKADDSPVTAADREAERILRGRIEAEFPADAILGEEAGSRAGSSGFRWILDPIDGTKSFICGVPLYATLVAVEYAQRSVIGVICVPPLDECVYAASGLGAWHVRGAADPQPARVAESLRLGDGLFVTSQIDAFATRGAVAVYREFERRAYITRTWGDAYGYLLVATGRAALMVDPVMNLWDAAALQPILEEAGGAFTDWAGRPTIYSGEAIACSRGLLEQALEVTRPFGSPSALADGTG